jgi:hypothetical protein
MIGSMLRRVRGVNGAHRKARTWRGRGVGAGQRGVSHIQEWMDERP